MSHVRERAKQTPKKEQEAARREEDLVLRARMQDIRRKLLVLSGKGGVGKSTVAANLAISMAQASKKVGLLDIDVHGPSVPKILGIEGCQIGVQNDHMVPVEVGENLSAMSIGLLLENPDDPVIWRGPRKYGVIRQFLKDVDWGRMDYLVVDSPPGTGDEPLSVAQLVVPGAEAVIVTTPQELSIADVRRCIRFCQALSLPIVGIIENMSGFLCPHCGQRTDLFKAGGGKQLAGELGLPLLGQVPVDPNVVVSGDAGVPFINGSANSPAGMAFAQITQRILEAHGDTQLTSTAEN